jgi:CheY-like chemotaxis protein
MKFNSLRDREGNCIGAYQFVYDVTQRLRDQERLRQAEEVMRQAQKMESLGQLTGGVAHDFNNLLAVISAGLQLLQRPGSATRRQRVFDGMRHAIERGTGLTSRLLAFSRRRPINPEAIDLARQLEGMREMLTHTLRGDVSVEMMFDDGLWPIEADAGELELAILNLCVNARDAMPDGGTIRITAENESAADGEFVKLALRDTGTGMPAHVQARVFEPFFTTKEVGKGTGLGLSMVYGFVRQSGGHVRIYSEVGLGTVVRLYVPHSDVAPLPLAIASPGVAEPASSAETILFVEDDPLVRKHTQDQLAELGYRVVTAENGPAALAQVEEGCTPDLLFTDLVMPGGINGHELARRLRRRWPDLPVLYCSGYAHDALAPDGETVPARNMLAKPYRRRELAAKLRELLDAPLAVGE